MLTHSIPSVTAGRRVGWSGRSKQHHQASPGITRHHQRQSITHPQGLEALEGNHSVGFQCVALIHTSHTPRRLEGRADATIRPRRLRETGKQQSRAEQPLRLWTTLLHAGCGRMDASREIVHGRLARRWGTAPLMIATVRTDSAPTRPCSPR